jgi:hypothetical protein
LHLDFNLCIIPYMTNHKEAMKNPMDLVPNDPIEILKGLPSAEFPRDWSMKFSDLLKNSETYKGREREIADISGDTLEQLHGQMIKEPTEKGYLYLSVNDVFIGLAEANNDLTWDVIEKWGKKSEEIENDQGMQMSKKAESLLSKRPTKQLVTPQ